MKKYELIKSFTIYSMIAFILTGIFLSQITYRHVREDDMKNIIEIAVVSIKSIVQNNLEKSDFKSILSTAKEQNIASSLNDFMNEYDINSITIINNKREIMMSGKSSFSIEDRQNKKYLDEIFNDNVPYVVSKTFVINDETDSKTRNSYFSLFVPVTYDSEVEGVFILRIPSEIVSSHANVLIREIALALAGGLLILFLLLIGILYRTSKTLIALNEHLNTQKNMIEDSYVRLNSAYKSTVVAMSNAVDARDSYTAGHSARVSKISLILGKELGLSEIDLKNLEFATLFHDLGKIGISDNILNKSGKLSDEEYDIIKKHPSIGVSILKDIDFLADALPLIRHHHERFGGGGYPSGLKGEDIPLGARIIAVADTYDAMTSDRPYRLGLDHESAINEIIKNKGSQFDDRVVDAFMEIESGIKNR